MGHTHHMEIDGVDIDLGLNRFSNSRSEAVEKIIKILKENYNLEYTTDDIKFKWGGRL